MSPQDQSGNNLKVDLHRVELKEQISSGSDYALKVRKPYTITKQRERWTEEEHKKFLEALKLFGRAWKKIEEHVGTKSAVQIRSHAQKFFSKVVRESNGSATITAEPIEIPPPRPKRKPAHPYPRKLSNLLAKEHKMTGLQIKSTSQQLYALEQDNQSPTSVLSAVGSDTMASTDSSSPNRSLSPVSSAGTPHQSLVLSGTNSSAARNVSPSPGLEPTAVIQENKMDKKFELFPNEVLPTNEVSTEEASNQSLKLFGKTVVVSDLHKQTSPSKSQSPEVVEVKPVRLNTRDFSLKGASNLAPSLTCNKDSLDSGFAAYATQCWTLSGAGSSPFVPYQLLRRNSETSCKEDHDNRTHKEGSLSGSNTGPVDQGETSFVMDAEAQSRQLCTDLDLRKPDAILQFMPSERSAFSRLKTTSTKCTRGFVPYKRCLAERDTASSSRIEQNDETRIRLSL